MELDEELIRLDSDIDYKIGIGNAVQDPPFHFARVMDIFSIDVRKRLLSKAYRTMKAVVPGKYSIEQFVIMSLYGGFYEGWGYQPDHLAREMLFSDALDASRYDYSIDRSHHIIYLSDMYEEVKQKVIANPMSVSLGDLPTHRDDLLVTTTVNCTNPKGLGAVFSGTVFSTWGLGESDIQSEVLEFFQSALQDVIVSDIQAAGLASCAEQLECIFNSYDKDSNVLIQNASYDISSPRWDNIDTDEITDKLSLLSRVSNIEVPETRPIIKSAHDRLVLLPELCEKYSLEVGDGGFYIPIARQPLVSRSIREVILKAEKDRSSLLSLSPRKFEVSLSKATRDGGADLVCLKNHHGIPFSMAVEVKRYTNKPVDVRLVRSFVGSNREFKANRLLFITTSSYTKPAMEYAENYAGHFLSLASYDDIRQWCFDVRTENSKLFNL